LRAVPRVSRPSRFETMDRHVTIRAHKPSAVSERDVVALVAHELRHPLAAARRGDLQLEMHDLDLRSIVIDAAATYGVRARERGVNLTKEVPFKPVATKGDPVRLQQVVANVLENALKHTPRDGQIRARLTTREHQAILSIRDTGDGIPADVLPHVFEPFQHHGNGGGLGIGLNVARRLVELHGGRIRARSAGVGKGAEFVITLPLAKRRSTG
jgi:signal transduction histidine kinase